MTHLQADEIIELRGRVIDLERERDDLEEVLHEMKCAHDELWGVVELATRIARFTPGADAVMGVLEGAKK